MGTFTPFYPRRKNTPMHKYALFTFKYLSITVVIALKAGLVLVEFCT